MNKVVLIDFTGGFSESIRPDLLTDNVCQVIKNCEVNQSGLLERRLGFEQLTSFTGKVEGDIVWSWLWNSYHRYKGLEVDHVIILTKKGNEYLLYLFVDNHIERLFKDLKINHRPSLAITDRKVYVTFGKEEYLHYIEITKKEELEQGIYDVLSPIQTLTVQSKTRVSHSENSTLMPFGCLLQYCYTYEDSEGKESKPSPTVSYFKEQFLWEGSFIKNVLLKTGASPVPTSNIKYINIYRRHSEYSESLEGFTDFYFVARIKITNKEHIDDASENVIRLELADYRIKGDEVVYLDNTLFVSGGIKEPDFIVDGLFVQEIVFSNNTGKHLVNKVILLEVLKDDVLFKYLNSANYDRNRVRFVDMDTRTPLRVCIYSSTNTSVLLLLEVPYLYPFENSVFFIVDCVSDSSYWIEPNDFSTEIMVKNINVSCCIGSEYYHEGNLQEFTGTKYNCTVCNGTGWWLTGCVYCNGTGKIFRPCTFCNDGLPPLPGVTLPPCEFCGDEGGFYTNCKECNGTGKVIGGICQTCSYTNESLEPTVQWRLWVLEQLSQKAHFNKLKMGIGATYLFDSRFNEGFLYFSHYVKNNLYPVLIPYKTDFLKFQSHNLTDNRGDYTSNVGYLTFSGIMRNGENNSGDIDLRISFKFDGNERWYGVTNRNWSNTRNWVHIYCNGQNSANLYTGVAEKSFEVHRSIQYYYFITISWKYENKRLTFTTYIFLKDYFANSVTRIEPYSYTTHYLDWSDRISTSKHLIYGNFTRCYEATDKYIDNEQEAFALHNHLQIADPNHYIGYNGTTNKNVLFREPEDQYRQGLGMLYFSNERMQFLPLNYVSTRAKILKMIASPVFLETDYYNSLLLFSRDRVDRLLIHRDDKGVFLNKGLVNNLYNTFIKYPDMIEQVEGNVYFVSEEGLMRFSQNGIECISGDVIDINRYQQFFNENSFIQYIPDKKQIWFYANGMNIFVYDLKRGVFYKFIYGSDLIKGFFSDKSKFFRRLPNGNQLFVSYPASSSVSSDVAMVKSKLFMNKSKMKRIRTRSRFGKMFVRFRQPRPAPVSTPSWDGNWRTLEYNYNEKGVYILPHGAKGDFEIEFHYVDALDFMELYFR